MSSGSREAVIRFRADTKELTSELSQVNKSLSNLKSDLKLANSELKAGGDSFEGLSKKANILQEAMQENGEKIQLLQKKLEACKSSLGENSDEYSRLYKQLNKAKSEQAGFQAELNQTEKRLDSLGDEADQTSKDIKELGDSFDEVDGSSSGLQGVLQGLKGSFDMGSVSAVGLGTALGNLASGAISACIDAIKDFASYLWELPEATAEFRTNMAKLSGATQQYNYDAEATNDLVSEMYGYFNDEQVAVNAITNLQGIGLSQSDLNTTLDSAIAVWTAYGDSIPIESLTESINETSQVGKVTGALADALNWAGISEDEFNKKLEATKGTQERAKLITDTLNGAYGESKELYDKNTQSLRDYQTEQFNTMDAQSQLAEQIEPYKTAWEDLKNTLLLSLVPALQTMGEWIQNIKQWFLEFSQSPTWELLSTVGTMVLSVVVDHFQKLWAGIQLVCDVLNILWTIIEPVWNLLMEGINTAIKPLSDAFKNLASDTDMSWKDITSKVQEGAEKIADFIEDVINYAKKIPEAWNTLKSATTETWNNLKTTVTEAINNIKNAITTTFTNIKTTITEAWNSIKTTIKNAWTEIKTTCTNAINEIKNNSNSGFSGVKTTITNAFTSIKSTCSTAWSNIKTTIINAISNIKTSATSGFNNIKTTATSAFNSVKTSVTTGMNNAKTVVTSALSTIKSKLSGFKPSWSIPKPKLPKVSVSIKTKSIAGLSVPYPSFSVSWNALGGIFKKPTIFNTPNGLQGVGEAGAEAILPLDSFYNHLDNKLEELQTGNTININLNDVHLHDDLDINDLTEKIAFNIQRRTRLSY